MGDLRARAFLLRGGNFQCAMFLIKKRRYLPHCYSDKGLNGTNVNRAYHSVIGGLLEIRLYSTLKGVLAKNERVYRLMAQK